VDEEVPLEDEVAAVFDLVDGVVAVQVYSFAVLLGKLGTKQPTPVVQPLFDDGSAQFVSGGL
jgi:hypothetical protein